MHRLFARGLFGLLAVLVLFGCSRPEGPQEVTEAFWQAVMEGDADGVAELSTLISAAEFDGYGRDWLNTLPSYGRVVIDGTEATVVTQLPAKGGASAERREITTFLVEKDGQWFVDYALTGKAVNRTGPFDGLMGEINKLGDRLSSALDRSSNDLSQEMDQMAEDFETYSAEVERRTEEAMEKFGGALQNLMKDLEESIEEALKENQQAPKQDRQGLEQAAYDLNQSGDQLDEPDFDALADASRALSKAGNRITSVSSETFEPYQDEWQEKLEEAKQRTTAFFKDLQNSF